MKALLVVLATLGICTLAQAKPCTEEAKVCPDGSTVVRDGNNDCKFAECPTNNKDLLVCGDIHLKIKPQGTRMAKHMFLGQDINNATVWVESEGKSYQLKKDMHSEGANFLVKNFNGKDLKIAETERGKYGAFVGKDKPIACVAGQAKPTGKPTAQEAAPEGEEGSAE